MLSDWPPSPWMLWARYSGVWCFGCFVNLLHYKLAETVVRNGNVISLVWALGAKSFWILFGNVVFLYPWTAALKSFQEETILGPGCGIILRPPHGHCMQSTEEGKKLYKTTNHFVSKKIQCSQFFCKVVFLTIICICCLYFYSVFSGEIEELSPKGEKHQVPEQLFTFHAWVMWKMPSVETVMNILKVHPTY